MKAKKERIEYLDLLKGISIILVVFCHKVTLPSDTILGNIIMAMAWAAVPNFFFVTGGLMHQSKELKWKKYLNKLLRAYIVLCVWKLLYLLFYSTFQEVTFSKTDLIEYLFVFGDISGVDAGHIWFMYAYLFVLLFLPGQLVFIQKRKKRPADSDISGGDFIYRHLSCVSRKFYL